MDSIPETFGAEHSQDPLIAKQKHDVDMMRTTLLTCNISDPNSVKAAMNNILVMRVYHQISRIIKYTEQMDKIEAKLYDSIDQSLENMNEADPRTWITLLNIQERLQKIMIDSHKLIEPYLKLEDLTYVEVVPEISTDSFAKTLLDQDSRERLRTTAQAILSGLTAGNNNEPSAMSEDT